MRVAAVALVLVVGAAVVLWFGNTLNSWVIGGLIGGLTALLLSIPISLTLFSFLSHRQDERLRAEEQEQEEFDHSQFYDLPEELVEEVYEADASVLSHEQVAYEDLKGRRMQVVREIPASSSYRQLPAAGQSQASASARSFSQQGSIIYPAVPRQQLQSQSQPLPAAPGKSAPVQRASTNGKTYYPGFPGYKANSMRAQQQTAALRAAQREAAQQYNGMEVLPTTTSQLKRFPVARPSQSLAQQPARPVAPGPARQIPQQMANQYPRQRVVDTTLAQQTSVRHRLPGGGESTANRTGSTDALRTREYQPQTDQLGESYRRYPNYPQTGQMLRQFQTQQTPKTQHTQQTGQIVRNPQQAGQIARNSQQQTGQMARNPQQQTGQIARNPQVYEQRRNPDVITGSLKNPLLRRAPYMYEDDPLRQELAQQIDTPIVRRSSRFEEED